MLRRSASVLAFLLYVFAISGKARADTTLNRAVVETIRNQVQLLLQNQSSRSAQVSDVLVPGDGVSTADDSLAELRFNDGSLGRLGEQVIFWFTPGTRNFSLSNGTVLLLIPPGQGRTTIQTPNASAGIQGSALFVRYIEETDTTIVGALTDSNIEVSNEDGTQEYTLAGGQMAVAVGDRITDIFEFDLQTFYETSSLARDLAPTFEGDRDTSEAEAEQTSTESSESSDAEVEAGQSNPEANSRRSSPNQSNSDRSQVDPAIEAVQAEMQTALDRQRPISAENSVETPDFLRMPSESSANEDSSPPASANSRESPGVIQTEQSQDQEAINVDPSPLRNPVNDPERRTVGEPLGRDIDEIPSGHGPNNNTGRGPDDSPGRGLNDDNPGRGPDDNPGRGPDDNPGRGPDDNPGRGPDDNPGRGPDDNPGRGPDDNPGRGPDDNPGRGPDDNPGRGPDDNPGRGPDDNPGRGPDDNPGRGPDDNPGRGPDDDNPGRGPDDNPGRGPDDNPGRGPDDNPGRGPDDNPGRGPDDNPGRGPDDNPGRGPDDNPGLGPDDNPGLGPNDNPGRGPNN